MKYLIAAIVIALWCYLLWVLSRAKLHFWKFLVGSVGLFLILLVLLEPVLTQPLARAVSALAGVVGSLTGIFTSYFKYGIIFVPMQTGAMTLKIDFECSGIIEIFAFLSLLAFFRVYKPYEKIIVGVIGAAYIMVCNALRIIVVCLALHFFGQEAYFITHTFIGRIFFYVLSILLYFYVFTKPQVIQMKVGNFSYGNS